MSRRSDSSMYAQGNNLILLVLVAGFGAEVHAWEFLSVSCAWSVPSALLAVSFETRKGKLVSPICFDKGLNRFWRIELTCQRL